MQLNRYKPDLAVRVILPLIHCWALITVGAGASLVFCFVVWVCVFGVGFWGGGLKKRCWGLRSLTGSCDLRFSG